MSIASEITRINNNISAAYTACNNKGATMPQTQDSANLATTIGTISGGGRSWSQIGYSAEPSFIGTGFTYAKNIYDNWSPTTSYSNKFLNDNNLVFMPLVNTSTGTNFSYMFASCSSLLYVPNLVTSSGTNFNHMFYRCYSLIDGPTLTTSSGTDFSQMFYECYSLKTVPLYNTSSGTNFSSMFRYCRSLASLPTFDLSTGTDLSYMFYGCISLTTIPSFDTSKATNMSYMFNSIGSGLVLPLLDCSECVNFTNMVNGGSATFGGFKNAGKAYLTTATANKSEYELKFSLCNSLSEQSLINILTNLYDIATKGCNAQKCTLGATNLAKLTSSAGQAALSTAQTKGWTVS